MQRIHDPLTYRAARTWAEVISRHPCAGDEAIAGWRYRRPLRDQIARGVAAGVSLSFALVCLLDYFDVLVP